MQSADSLEMNKQTIDHADALESQSSGPLAITAAELDGLAADAGASAADIQRKSLSELSKSINITDLQGNYIDAQIIAIEHSPEFEKYFFENGGTGDSLWGNWILFDYRSESKKINLEKDWAPTGLRKLIFIIEAEGYLSESKFLSYSELQQKEISIKMFEASAILVKVVAEDDTPLANINVRRYGVRDNGASGNGSFEQQVRAKLLTNSALTDANGQIVFKNIEQLNHLVVEGNGEYSAAQKYAVIPGQEVVFSLTNTFVVSGHVYDTSGKPLAGIGVGAYLGFGAPDRNIQSVETDASGYYEMRSLTATASNVEVLTYSPEMVSQVRALPFPKLGESYELDFVVPTGVGGRYHFVTSWREPMAQVGVGFLKKEHDWVAYQYQIEEDGWVDCQKAFDPQLSYYVNFVMNGLELRGGFELIPGGEQEVVVDGIARIAEIEWSNQPVDQQPIAYVFRSKNSNAMGDARWRSKNDMPFLPAGAGVLDVIWPKKVKQSFQVVLEENGDNVLHLDYARAEVRFTLPQGVNASAKLVSDAGFTTSSAKGLSGEASFYCSPGTYHLIVKTDSSYTTIADLQVGKSGLNLGDIALSDSAMVYGTLLNEDGNPWRGADVIVATVTGEFLGEAITDEGGNFIVEGLAAGNARLAVLPVLSLGRVGSAIIKNISLVPGDKLGPFNLQMASDRYLTVKFSPWGLPRAQGFCLEGQTLHYNDVSSEGFFQVSSPRSNSWVGAGAASFGRAWWYAQQVTAEETSATISRVSETKTYRFVDAQQRELSGMSIKFEIGTAFLPGTATTDTAGKLQLEMSPGLDLDIIAMLPGGGSQRWSVLETIDGLIETAAGEDPFIWSIVSSSGGPLAGAVCAQQQGYGGMRSNAFGEVSMPAPLAQTEFTVSASGHISLLATPGDRGRLVLPRQSKVSTLRIDDKRVSRLSYEPASDDTFARDLRHMLVSDGSGSWALGPVPAGLAMIKGYAADGAVVWSKEVTIPQGPQSQLTIE